MIKCRNVWCGSQRDGLKPIIFGGDNEYAHCVRPPFAWANFDACSQVHALNDTCLIVLHILNSIEVSCVFTLLNCLRFDYYTV